MLRCVEHPWWHGLLIQEPCYWSRGDFICWTLLIEFLVSSFNWPDHRLNVFVKIKGLVLESWLLKSLVWVWSTCHTWYNNRVRRRSSACILVGSSLWKRNSRYCWWAWLHLGHLLFRIRSPVYSWRVSLNQSCQFAGVSFNFLSLFEISWRPTSMRHV